MYTPETECYLLNTPLTMDGEHQILYDTPSFQASYFLTCPKLYLSELTFQRKDSVLRVGVDIEQLYQYNYVMYRNKHFTNKWFYAFITKMEYKGEGVTFIYLKTDVFQTWFYDLTFNKSFIDRQHPLNDSFNSIADTPAHGQLIEVKSDDTHFQGGYFVFCSSDISQDDTSSSNSYEFSVLDYSIPCMVLYWADTQALSMASVLQSIANKGRGDRILSAVYVPYIPRIAGLNITEVQETDVGNLHICNGFSSPDDLKGTILFEYGLGVSHEYEKEFTYPYAKIVVQDTATGQSIELSPEKFGNGTTIQFEIQVAISETPTYRIIPKDYDGQPYAYNEALVVKCNTSLPVSNNLYAKYMMMNGQMNELKKVFAGVGMAGAIAGGSPMGVITGMEQIINVTAQENQASKLGNQLTAITDGAMERISFNNGIKIGLFKTDSDHTLMLRNYWKMYGYPVHSLETPVFNNGGTFNFIKMINPNIEGGNVPQEDMMEIESIFTKGVTVWHTGESYKKY